MRNKRSGNALRRPTAPRYRASAICGALALSAVCLAPVGAQEKDRFAITSSHAGVYTDAQADEGQEIFNANCSNCHNESNPLGGDRFLKIWSGQSLWRLYEFMSTRMPYPAPGTLKPEQYSALMAYVLRRNGYPSGSTPLPVVPFEIAHINLDPHPAPTEAP